jgi:flagellar M-ring protein FliF
MADTLPVPTPPARTVLDTVPGLKQLLLLVGIAASVAAAVWLVIWSQGPAYSLLYAELAERESGQVIEALTSAGIPYKLEGGAILVPESQVHEARIKLAGQGLPQSDGMGAELEKNQGFGVSQFMETARYQHALETELARTIGKVQGVQTARVHLALPPPSAFVRDRNKASAAVMLELYGGRRLDSGQVAAIVHVVASGVPELEAGQVTVIDQNGTLLNAPDDGSELALTARQFEYTRQVEESYSKRIEDLLVPLVGPERVRARVTADLDFTQTEQTHEGYDPAKTAMRSEQTVKDQRLGGDLAPDLAGAGGEPPAAVGSTPDVRQQSARPNGSGLPRPLITSTQSTRNFEVDRTISHTRQAAGTLRKLSVAVIVDDWEKTDADGNVKSIPLTNSDIERLTKLVKEAVGYDEARGDRVNVMNASFHASPPLPEPEGPSFLEQSWVKTATKQGTAVVLVLILAFVVLKPIMRTLTQPARGSAGSDLAGDRVTLSGVPAPMLYQPPYEQQVAAARGLVGQDPKRAAQVVKEWVNG